jgi:hypothetical protein
MKATRPRTPSSAPCTGAADILGKARRVLWSLQADPSTARTINGQAAAAITHGRHGNAGRDFAAEILKAVGANPTAAQVEAAIRQNLQVQ